MIERRKKRGKAMRTMLRLVEKEKKKKKNESLYFLHNFFN